MRYYIPSTSKIIESYNELRGEFPNVSLPKNVDIPELGVYILYFAELPEFDIETEYAELGDVIFTGTRYEQQWVIVGYGDPGGTTNPGTVMP